MPGRDGTGPMGRGSMTGGGFGNCAGRGQGAPGQGFGGGMGRGGAGRGMRRMFQAGGRFGFNAPDQDSDAAMENRQLMKQNETLRMELDAIMKRLDEMEARTAGSK